MNPEQQVVSLELSKKLKELGIKQKSLWYWCSKEGEAFWLADKGISLIDLKKHYSAFTADEFHTILPDGYYVCQKCLWCGDKGIEINHINNDIDKPLDYANAMAKMVIYLKLKIVMAKARDFGSARFIKANGGKQ